ncbi:hypothetical protein M2451_000403 [Dysgonomonas sp. PFB1-18]|uniref:hypothetical protein n=1 Tax=unclassified Dysgonomonas TaxID=2630389 RepID=UPI0024760218|nr:MULTISPECIES: hypothetical protein [unclassified Dysgonomonas]MDL2303320.1 hypothetical protein [Dysgonomonas sp. OttesenSCG-928-D17]MDH6307254.1 hypothetical protein [Dysgonomonas sp. PF1-14]MDH6337172.1 hypothetical protein [Dysgonomonas sp. PF1-16]MDH6379096.1 hypothetical protein [Dysgonomonas sp. PFB1-18]MDH6396267.1 hypothetical protein [Dysgonomonas sp. PF1-23]
MKNLSKILVLFLFTAFLFSCSNDDDNNQGDDTIDPTLAEVVTDDSKWISISSDSRILSLEFNSSGNYIAVENTLAKSTNGQQIRFGTYTRKDASTISLSGLGTVKVSSIINNTATMEITLTGSSTPIIFRGVKLAEMASTTKTDMLCQTWEIVKYNGESAVGTEFDAMTVLFSKAGTYFVTAPNGGDDMGGLAEWKWKPDTNETEFLYTWNGSFEGDYAGSFATINELTATYLKITEVFEDEDDATDVWEFKSIKNTKSSVSSKTINSTFGNGIFGTR